MQVLPGLTQERQAQRTVLWCHNSSQAPCNYANYRRAVEFSQHCITLPLSVLSLTNKADTVYYSTSEKKKKTLHKQVWLSICTVMKCPKEYFLWMKSQLIKLNWTKYMDNMKEFITHCSSKEENIPLTNYQLLSPVCTCVIYINLINHDRF